MLITNNYNTTSPAFGMLKIKPEALYALKKCSMEYLTNIEKAGEELKDITTYDVILGKKLKPTIVSTYSIDGENEAYSGYIRAKVKGNLVTLQAFKSELDSTGEFCNGKSVDVIKNLGSSEAAQRAYYAIKNAHSEIDNAVAVTKLLHNSREVENGVPLNNQLEQRKINSKIFQLLKQFGNLK